MRVIFFFLMLLGLTGCLENTCNMDALFFKIKLLDQKTHKDLIFNNGLYRSRYPDGLNVQYIDNGQVRSFNNQYQISRNADSSIIIPFGFFSNSADLGLYEVDTFVVKFLNFPSDTFALNFRAVDDCIINDFSLWLNGKLICLKCDKYLIYAYK